MQLFFNFFLILCSLLHWALVTSLLKFRQTVRRMVDEALNRKIISHLNGVKNDFVFKIKKQNIFLWDITFEQNKKMSCKTYF